MDSKRQSCTKNGGQGGRRDFFPMCHTHNMLGPRHVHPSILLLLLPTHDRSLVLVFCCRPRADAATEHKKSHSPLYLDPPAAAAAAAAARDVGICVSRLDRICPGRRRRRIPPPLLQLSQSEKESCLAPSRERGANIWPI